MKSTFRILLFIMTITFCGVNAYAQKDNRQRMTREQLAETQAKYITKEMAMDDVTAEKFIKTFCQFQKTFGHLVPDLKEILQTARKLEAEQALEERFSHSKRY